MKNCIGHPTVLFVGLTYANNPICAKLFIVLQALSLLYPMIFDAGIGSWNHR